MTKDELGQLVAERQFRRDDARLQLQLTPTVPIFTLRRGMAVKIDPGAIPTAEVAALGFSATVELTTRTWRVEGYSASVSIDPVTGQAHVERGTISCEEVAL